MAKPGKETLVVRRIRANIDKVLGRECWHVKIHGGGIPAKHQQAKVYSAQDVGLPDLILSFGGVFIGAEVKVYPGRFSKMQLLKLREIHISGGVACGLVEMNGNIYGLTFPRVMQYANGMKKDNVLTSFQVCRDKNDKAISEFFAMVYMQTKLEREKFDEFNDWANHVISNYSLNVIQLKGKR